MGSCSTNLGPLEQRKRWTFGVLALSTATMLALACDDHCLWSRIAIGLLFVVASFCVMQARAQTCVLLAYTGRKNLDAGAERILDRAERRAAMHRATMVSVKALAFAILGMALLALL